MKILLIRKWCERGVWALAAVVVGAVLSLAAAVAQSQQVGISKPNLRGVAAALGAVSAQQAINAVGAHLLSVPAQGADKWAGLQSFAVESSGGAGQGWNIWARDSWSLLEGSPQYGGQRADYEGEGVSFYSGFDRQKGNWRLGLAGGYQLIDVDAIFGGDDVRNDKIVQHYYSLLPYVEYTADGMRLRLIGGGGLGRTEIEIDSISCRVRMKSDWYLGGAEAEFLLVEGDAYDFMMRAAFSSNGGNLKQNNCAANIIPGLQFESSEALFGWRIALGKGADFRPYMLIDFRKNFGDLRDDVAYDLGGGGEWLAAPWRILAEARTQAGNLTTHRRHSISGVLLYNGGGLDAQWRSGIEQGADIRADWVNRWELNAVSERSLHNISAGLYAENRHIFVGGTKNKVGANLRVEFLSGR